MKKLPPLCILLIIFALLVATQPAFAGSLGSDYLCDLGISYYERGDDANALTEFKKVLLIDPNNETALEYIAEIEGASRPQYTPPVRAAIPAPRAAYIRNETPAQKVYPARTERYSPPDRQAPPVRAEYTSPPKKQTPPAYVKDEAVYQPQQQQNPETQSEQKSGLKVSGQVQASIGVDSRDGFLWNRANFDLNEKNWRMLSTATYDKKSNTYDPRIYDRLRVNVDTENEFGPGFHTTIMVDPWSFVGKTDKVTIPGAGGDSAEIELKYWGNTGYTLNESINTLQNGDSFSLPEINTHKNKTYPTTITSGFGNTFDIPALDINQQFQPVRELWFDYKQPEFKFKIYPFGYENQAVIFDDPLTLSGNKTWWEDSPWIRRWKPGNFNSGATPVDFTKGYWDNSISFQVKDSEGSRLTQLRGATLELGSKDDTRLITSIASSKDLWQDYSEFDNVISASRITHRAGDNLILGASTTERLGFNVNTNDKTDARSILGAVDATMEITPGIVASAETAVSKSAYDLTSPGYRTDKRGNAYYASLMGRNDSSGLIDAPYGFGGIAPEKGENLFTKWRLIGAHLDKGFDPSLSSYVETRDDEFWSRHIHFRKPYKFYSAGFYTEPQTFDDVKPFAIGNGIDVGRDVIGFRMENSIWDRQIENLIDVRNVHETNGKYIETTARDELTVKLTDKMTFKGLGLLQDLPKTHAGVDPFVYNPTSGRYFDNNQITDGQDPSIKTGSAGLNYDFFDWLSLNGVWEHTNDYYLGYDSFPRGLLNDGNMSSMSDAYGLNYRATRNWLYDQQYFPNAPYQSYDIFKAEMRFAPFKNLEMYFNWTRNEYEKAGQVDNNMNHIGTEIHYLPTPKLHFNLHYQYSRWQDLETVAEGTGRITGHHNVFLESMYLISKDSDLVLQFGEASRMPMYGEMITITWDPYPGSLWRSIDTQHIIRLFYRLRF
ncbi:MAG: tetratricopeptide repeat protein [Candidatus Omnitrophota bacterium]